MQGPLSQSQLDGFARDGFVLWPNAVPEAELAGPDIDSMTLIDRGSGGPFGDDRWRYQDDDLYDRKCLYRVNGLLDDDMPPSFGHLLAYPRLLAAVRQLVGGDAFATSVPSLVFKVPRHGAPAPWHQDPVEVFRFPVFNMDIYLDDATVDNACLWVLPGSHLAGYHSKGTNPEFIASWTGGLEHDAEGAVPVEARRGDVIFHATTLVHGSFWNRSEDLRRTVYFHFDHWEDVRLAGDRWPQNGFETALRATQHAIDSRAVVRPGEEPFELPAREHR